MKFYSRENYFTVGEKETYENLELSRPYLRGIKRKSRGNPDLPSGYLSGLTRSPIRAFT